MDKNEVANYLNCSPRTVNRYVESGKLKVIYVDRKGTFDEKEVEDLKKELSTPVHRSIVATDNNAIDDSKEEFWWQIAGFLLSEVKKESRFAHLEDLERCAAYGWQLPSHELKDLIKLKRLPRSPFFRYGFIFERSGRWWRVKKNEASGEINV